MFGILKKKITGFINRLTKKEEEKESVPTDSLEKKEELKVEMPEKKVDETPASFEEFESKEEVRHVETVSEPLPEPPEKEIKKVATDEKPKKHEPIVKEKRLRFSPEKAAPPKKKPEQKEEVKETVQKSEEEVKKVIPEKKEKKGIFDSIKNLIVPKKEEKPVFPKIEVEKRQKEPMVKLGIAKQIKSVFTGTVEIAEKDVEELLESLELDLLESDVALEVAESIKDELKNGLVGQTLKKDEVSQFVKKVIRDTIIKTISVEKKIDILNSIKQSEKPVKIMIIGTNGAGKTTPIGKLAKLFMSQNHKVVFAAADTFRAAAIEQMEVHAKKLGVHLIKREYGADPTAVAYDAVSYSKAHGIDVVLIDTAGRQDTNVNLINELKKMNRIINPNFRIYIGESIAGNAIIEQVSTFNQEIGIDGVILTKLDCDAKGGSVLSISKTTGVPIIYLGTGQQYEDLEKFEAEKIADLILS